VDAGQIINLSFGESQVQGAIIDGISDRVVSENHHLKMAPSPSRI